MATKKRTIRTIPQERTPMPEQDPKVRARNFEEVACGYRLEDALRERERVNAEIGTRIDRAQAGLQCHA